MNTKETAQALLGYLVRVLDRGGIGVEPDGKGAYAASPVLFGRNAEVDTDRVPDALDLLERRGLASIQWDYPERMCGRGGFWIKPSIEGRVMGEEWNDGQASVSEKKTTHSKAPTIAFVKDPSLKSIAERDLAELHDKLIPNECAKSILVLAGSIVETLLLDALTKEVARRAAAESAKAAPRKKGGAVRSLTSDDPEDEWKLSHMIEVADELGLIPEVKRHTHAVLREYRNLVHPKLEAAGKLKVDMPEARSACATLEMVIRELSRSK